MILAAAFLALPAAAADRPAPEPWRVSLRVSAAPGVAERDRAAFERRLVVGLTEPLCGIELARDGTEAEAELEVTLERWRERRRPGGAAVFDPNTGRDRPGEIWEVEVRYRYALTRRGERKPVLRRSRKSLVRSASTSNPLWDPHRQARRRALDESAEEIARAACKARGKVKPGKARGEEGRPRN